MVLKPVMVSHGRLSPCLLSATVCMMAEPLTSGSRNDYQAPTEGSARSKSEQTAAWGDSIKKTASTHWRLI